MCSEKVFNTGQEETINVLHKAFRQITSHYAESSSSGPVLEVSGECSRSLQQLSVLSWLRSVHSDEWKQRKCVRPHLFFRQALATNRTTWRVGCCTADQISLILVMLQPLSCSGIASRAGWVSAEWLSVWSGMETETVGVMSDGCIWLFSVLPPGKSLPVFT